jgi:hypothetical protein
MTRYQPNTNPNDVLEGTIQRGSNGLYWISQPISNTNNNIRTWVLYYGVPNSFFIVDRNNIIDSDSDNYDPLTSPYNRLSRTTSLENSFENRIHRSLARSPATYDLTTSDAEDFIDILDSSQVQPRTIRDDVSYMSFRTDSVMDNQDDYNIYNDTESIIESYYDEDSDVYTNISSESDSIIDDKSELLSKCLNDSPVTLSNYDETDLNDLFVIYVPNKQGKFIKGSCLRRDELKDVLKSDLDTIPSYIMSIYKTPSSNRTDDLLTGMTGKPTGKIIVRIPTNQIYVTFGSLKRILSIANKEWYALPLYGGKSRRVGNLGGIYGSSMNHGQVPGFQIYKLFTKHDIENSIVSEEKPDDFPHVYQYDTMKSLFELVGDTPVNIFIHNILNELINTQIINIPQRTSSLQWATKRQRRYGNPPDEL